ncbi:hypothetical protein [Klebsiella variicola]|uniref:hypothetical protein n=1 Tax=Klebsiella variicola TaxID=244366 RepID=UPI0035A255DB|nr:hypothetical protein [Klebsiella variicola subsp. variicola]
MTDITELAQREKFEAWWEREYKHLESSKYTDAVPHIKYGFWMAYQAGGAELVEAVEKAQGMETYWKTQCRGITDHCEELQARIAELESHTVKPPVHPTVASEKLDDETLQELIEFRRTTFEYHSKEGNKVQTIIHGVTLAALRELQERRKADSEPVAEVVSIYGDPEAFGEREIRPLVGIQQMSYGTKLYRHAQQPVVPDDLAKAFISAIEKEQDRLFGEDYLMDSKDCIDVIREEAQRWNACCATMLQAGTLTNENTRQVDELTMWIKRLVRSLKNANPDSKLPRDAMDYLTAKGLISLGDVLR